MTTLLYHPERLAGVCSEVRAFFEWWATRGEFPITIPPNGGVRTDEAEQARLFAGGKSKAKTLADTPHGRGGAVDAYPAHVSGGRVAAIYLPGDGPAAMDRFRRFGILAETHSLVWGGRWLRAFPPHGDAPHVESPKWRELPMPGAA